MKGCKRAAAVGMLLLATSGVVWAAPTTTQVNFSVTTSEQVPNTQLHLLLQAVVQASGRQSVLAGLAARLDQRMNAALRMIGGVEGVTAQTRGLHSVAVYNKGHQIGWRLVGQIAVVGPAKSLPNLAGKLQAEGLSIESVRAEPGKGALETARARQTRAVIRALKRQARLVADSLGCSAWSFARVDLSDQGSAPPVGVLHMAAAKAPSAALAAGTSRIAVQASARMRCRP